MTSKLRAFQSCSLRPPRPSIARPAHRLCVRNAVATPTISDNDATKLDDLIQRWKAFDVDGNGSIDREELRHLLESTEGGSAVMFTEHWLPEEELDRIMDQYDKDKNGVIDFEEFKEIVYDGLLLDGKLSEYEAAFKAVDSSGNGTIGAMELAEVFRSLGNPISYEKLVEIMQRYDKDESGQIEFNEFLFMFRDELLDLKAVQQYMLNQPTDRVGSPSVLEHPDGDISLIFSEQELDEVIAASKRTNKVVVLFCALTWCRPCKGLQRPAQRLAENYIHTSTWVKLFGNANRQTKHLFKERLRVRSTPCLMVYKDGDLVFTHTGTNKEKLEAGLRAVLGLSPTDKPAQLYPIQLAATA